MITNKLKELVKQEAENLKKYALKKELKRLDFSNLYPQSYRACIYGQMTGDCYSKRAAELLNKCAQPYSGKVQKYLSPENKKFKDGFIRNFSPIEFYIAQDGAESEALINFLKGKSETLEL